jgi:ribosomal protein L11 methyltransferase
LAKGACAYRRLDRVAGIESSRRAESRGTGLSANWLEITVNADEEAVEAVAEVLRAHGRGVAIDEPFVQPRIDEPPMRDPSRRAVVKTYLPQDAAAEEARSRIEQALWHLGQLRTIDPPEVRIIAEEDWANAWKEYFPVLHIAGHTVIVPAWRRYRRRDGEVALRLDPGMAFGTGMHPTTRLCLSAVEELVQQGSRVLDVGTGSGILAIAAARHAAREVVGLDIDPVAVTAARANVRLNRLGRVVKIYEADPTLPLSGKRGEGEDPQRFDIVLANITARTNAALASFHAASLAPGGRLVASGILEDTTDLVRDAFAGAGLITLDVRQDGDWVALLAAHDA